MQPAVQSQPAAVSPAGSYRDYPQVCRVVFRTEQSQGFVEDAGSGVYTQHKSQPVVVTAAHVVPQNASQAYVFFPAVGKSYWVKRILGEDEKADVAILMLDKQPPLQPVDVAAVTPEVGKSVLCAGFPRRRYFRAASCRISARGDANHMWLACPSYEGQSGGPCLDARGRLCGVITATNGVETVITKVGPIQALLHRLIHPGQPVPKYRIQQTQTQLVPLPGATQQPEIQPPEHNSDQQQSQLQGPPGPPGPQGPPGTVDYDKVRQIVADEIAKHPANIDYGKINQMVAAEVQNQMPSPAEVDYDKVRQIVADEIAKHPANIDYDKINQMIAAEVQKQMPSPAEVDYDKIRAIIAEEVAKQQQQQPPPPQSQYPEWSHLVLLADSNAEYWPRLKDEFARTQGYYSGLRHVEPNPRIYVGPLPIMVAYSGGKPVRTWQGVRSVSDTLNAIVRGDYDKKLFPPLRVATNPK